MVIMRSSLRNFIWLLVAVVAIVTAIAFAAFNRPLLRLRVVEVRSVSGTLVARIEMHNRGDKPLAYQLHSIGNQPSYHWLQRYGRLWYRDLISECGMDLALATIMPGQTISFTAPVFGTSAPVRLALSYRNGSAEYTASTKAIEIGLP
jgi:hypothetical protein